MATQIKIRRDTAANWTTANPVLGAGEPGRETDTGKLKFGDGTTQWTNLPYFPGTINTADIADGAVTAGKLAANAVTADKIASNAVTASKISNAEQANIVAGRVRASGSSNGDQIVIHKGPASSQPTPVSGAFNFWIVTS